MSDLPPSVTALHVRLSPLGWVTDLLVAGSLATGDHRTGVSDLDLVALTAGPLDRRRRDLIRSMHVTLDRGVAAGADLGCAYVDVGRLEDHSARHPTWTHGALVERGLSGIVRADLVRYGYAVFGRAPADVFPPITDDDVRDATRLELTGYWSTAARRPWWWLDPALVDLGLTSMARGRHALSTGQLMTKTDAVEAVDAPAWLVDQLRARRHGRPVTSPRLRAGWVAWRDCRHTTSACRRT